MGVTKVDGRWTMKYFTRTKSGTVGAGVGQPEVAPHPRTGGVEDRGIVTATRPEMWIRGQWSVISGQ